jgi:molecular chaperone DnaK (HSP70)
MPTRLPITFGFDFGTSTTLVASADEVIPLGQESAVRLPRASMPSVFALADDGSAVLGEAATTYPPEQTVHSIKRFITDGRRFVRLDSPTGLRDLNADDLMVEILREAMNRAMAARPFPPGFELRLGCPAMWDGTQRRRLLDIAERAGLQVTLAGLVDEPVAAGIAWLGQSGVATLTPRRVVVFDMGGGSLDVAVLDVRGRRRQEMAVLAAIGVPEAGDSLDDAIASDLDLALAAQGVDVDALSNPERARTRLVFAAREAKEGLSYVQEHATALPRQLFGISDVWYTRDQLEQVFAGQMDRAEHTVITALMIAKMTDEASTTAYDILHIPHEHLTSTVDIVLLSGGMSQIPYVRQRMQELFGPTTTIVMANEEPDQAVALGLAKASRYGRINMYRPAFDILLEWDGDFRIVYDAFTPLVQPGQISRGGELRYFRNGLDLELPRQGKGKLRVVPQDGQRVRASLNGKNLDRFSVALSEQKFEFSIYPSGRIRLTDGSGVFDGQIEGWHS